MANAWQAVKILASDPGQAIDLPASLHCLLVIQPYWWPPSAVFHPLGDDRNPINHERTDESLEAGAQVCQAAPVRAHATAGLWLAH